MPTPDTRPNVMIGALIEDSRRQLIANVIGPTHALIRLRRERGTPRSNCSIPASPWAGSEMTGFESLRGEAAPH